MKETFDNIMLEVVDSPLWVKVLIGIVAFLIAIKLTNLAQYITIFFTILQMRPYQQITQWSYPGTGEVSKSEPNSIRLRAAFHLGCPLSPGSISVYELP